MLINGRGRDPASPWLARHDPKRRMAAAPRLQVQMEMTPQWLQLNCSHGHPADSVTDFMGFFFRSPDEACSILMGKHVRPDNSSSMDSVYGSQTEREEGWQRWPVHIGVHFIGPIDLFGTITSFDLFAKAAETGYDWLAVGQATLAGG